MTRDDEERNRVLGVPLGPGRSARQDEEHQRVLGFPVDWFGSIDTEWLRSLGHPVRRYRRWRLIRRLGPFAPDEGDPPPPD